MMKANNDQMLIYQSEDGSIKIDVRFEQDTVWLTQAQMLYALLDEISPQFPDI